jgi:hypothetical protein
MSKYKVVFTVIGTTSVNVLADTEDEAEEKARELLDDGFDVEDAEIDDVWDISEINKNEE